MNARLFALVSAAAGLIAAGGACGQSYGPPPGGGGGPGGYQNEGPPPQRSPQDVAQDLRRRLQLRPDQEAALQEFARAMAPPADTQARMEREQQQAASLTTPQRLDLMVSNMDEMRQVTLARVQATKAFYRQLSPDQQRAFDALGAGGARGPGGPGGN
ncbi:MAG TPA: Spy/CpxP family protein refolding chaperone [Caulobacteraceae bacterium]|nr:Spy/CpxP family protein refolding chaperone [Caulobacteraceae bacterium]